MKASVHRIFKIFRNSILLVILLFGLSFLLICMLPLWILFDCLILHEVTYGEVDVQCAAYSDLMQQKMESKRKMRVSEVFPVDLLIPSDASRIHFEGHGGTLFMPWGFAEFSCTVSESDFLKFASAWDYKIETNRLVNANVKNSSADVTLYEHCWGHCPKPSRFLTYTYIFSNNGGIQLIYEPATSTLRGSWASH